VLVAAVVVVDMVSRTVRGIVIVAGVVRVAVVHDPGGAVT
jgi:hypothetical protein